MPCGNSQQLGVLVPMVLDLLWEVITRMTYQGWKENRLQLEQSLCRDISTIVIVTSKSNSRLRCNREA